MTSPGGGGEKTCAETDVPADLKLLARLTWLLLGLPEEGGGQTPGTEPREYRPPTHDWRSRGSATPSAAAAAPDGERGRERGKGRGREVFI